MSEKRFRLCVYVYMAWIIVIAIIVGLPATFGQDELPPPNPPELVIQQQVAPLAVTTAIAPEYSAYSLAKFYIGDVTAAIDVYTVWNGQVIVTEAIETKRKGEFVFTGPPGKYTIRITTYDPTKGFATVTATTMIKPVGSVPVDPVVPPDPVIPQPPVDPNTPSTGPPAEGKFGIGLVAYKWLVANRPGDVAAIRQLATEYEWAAQAKPTGTTNPIGTINTELTKRVEAVYNPRPNIAGLRTAMQTQAKRLIDNGIITTLDDYQTAYRETAIGIRAAYGK